METDFDIIRDIFLKVEALGPHQKLSENDYGPEAVDLVGYNVRLMQDEGMVTGVRAAYDSAKKLGHPTFHRSLIFWRKI